MFKRNYLNYRLAIVELLSMLLLTPCLVFEAARLVLARRSQPSVVLRLLVLYPSSIVLYWTVRNAYVRWNNQRRAAKLGAVLPPTIVGKLPGSLDIVGMLGEDVSNGYAILVFRKFFEQTGSNTCVVRLMWQDYVFTIDEVHSRHPLTNAFSHWEKGDTTKYMMESSFGNGILNTDGELWKSHRVMTRPFFSKDRLSDNLTIIRHADIALSKLALRASQAHPHNAIDVQDLFARFTVDAACDFMFGTQLNSLQSALPIAGAAKLGARGVKTDDASGSFFQALDQVLVNLQYRFSVHPMWMLEEFWSDKMGAPMKVVHEYVERIARQAIEESEVLKEKGGTLDVESCTMSQYLAGNNKDPLVLRDQLVTMLLGGRDTTASLLTFCIYALALHPEVMKRLRQEVITHCGTDLPPSLETVRKMKYLRAVLDETLRLFPPVPAGQRISKQDTLLPPNPNNPAQQRPYFVPAGTDFAFFPLLMHRRTDLWSDDAEEFVPERWLDERRPEGAFLSFGAGPRTCIGQQFALNEASYFMARLLQRVEGVELALDAQPEGGAPPAEWQAQAGRQSKEKVHPKTAIILYAKGGMWVRFKMAE